MMRKRVKTAKYGGQDELDIISELHASTSDYKDDEDNLDSEVSGGTFQSAECFKVSKHTIMRPKSLVVSNFDDRYLA